MKICDSAKLKWFISADNLKFLGFLVFQNKLKKQTIPTLQELRSTDVKTVMATGDNLQTAIAIGKECGIIGSSTAILQGDYNHA